MSADDQLRIAQALLRACQAELVESRLSEHYGVTLLVHPLAIGPHTTTALVSTLSTRRETRALMSLTLLKSLELEGVDIDNVSEVAASEAMATLSPLDINDYDCPNCGPRVRTVWDADSHGTCARCGADVKDVGREETRRRRAMPLSEFIAATTKGGKPDANT